jgi:hypothetical protein
MDKLNIDTITLIAAADLMAGCSVQQLREAYAGLEKREQRILRIKSLVRTYRQFGWQAVEP